MKEKISKVLFLSYIWNNDDTALGKCRGEVFSCFLSSYDHCRARVISDFTARFYSEC